MRDTIKAAGLRAPDTAEPATASRLRTMLTRVHVNAQEIRDSVDCTIPHYLTMNPGLPLWAAVALILEATGRFFQKVRA